MEEPRPCSGAGYSPQISAQLFLNGAQLQVASLGPGSVVLEDPKSLPPGSGTIQMKTDGRLTVYHIKLPHGVSPDRREQPFLLIRVAEEAA